MSVTMNLVLLINLFGVPRAHGKGKMGVFIHIRKLYYFNVAI